MPRRIFIVGTDTEVGKTAVAAAILRRAIEAGLRAIPFKPAASGGDDPERLLAAAGLGPELAPRIAPLRYAPPLAPGIADEPRPFVGEAGGDDEGRGPALLARIAADLDALEATMGPELTVIEGAGGWHVPMPGGTWLPAWVDALGGAPVIVGRRGLGTINHTLLTIDAIRRAGQRPLGFILSETDASDDPSRADNPRIIAAASGLPCLGILGHGADAIDLRPGAWERIVGA
ncbi:MAG: dethiobiotin synthase [Myxococcales bacterium]|nr:dethiobiotin synthase [Myxococcales bacterium]